MTLLFAMALFVFSMSITPGPMNIVMLTNGVNYGFRRTVPFAIGVMAGTVSLVAAVGLGLSELSGSYDGFLEILGYVGAAVIAYLGFKISMSRDKIQAVKDACCVPGPLMGYVLALANPKSWMAIIAGLSAFSLFGKYDELLLFGFLYSTIGLGCILTWAYAGSRIARFLSKTIYLRAFNLTMGSLLIIIALYLLEM